jgi:hypothetical protein
MPATTTTAYEVQLVSSGVAQIGIVGQLGLDAAAQVDLDGAAVGQRPITESLGPDGCERRDAGAPFSPGINEAASTVAGTYLDRPITGQAYVEQFGIWK